MPAKRLSTALDRRTHHGLTPDEVWGRCAKYRVDHIVQAAADECGITTHEVCSAARTHRVSRARCVVWLRLKEHGWSLMEIAALFDRDHTSIGSGINSARRRMVAREEVRNADG